MEMKGTEQWIDKKISQVENGSFPQGLFLATACAAIDLWFSLLIPTKPIVVKMMCAKRSDWDALSVVVGLMVFALPLSLLLPGFSVWDVIPKVRVSRFHILDQHVTWPQLNAALVTLIAIFFCLYLELRKRELDEMVDSVLSVSQATEAAMEMERERQAAAVRVCVKLLDASAEHYESLVLLSDDLRKREKPDIEHPPEIEPSISDV